MSVIPTILYRYTAICITAIPTILNRYTAICITVIPTILNRYTAICMSIIPTILNKYTAIKTTPSRGKRIFVCPKFPDSLRAQLAAFQWVLRDPSPDIRGGGGYDDSS
jgi:hypothetical protein